MSAPSRAPIEVSIGKQRAEIDLPAVVSTPVEDVRGARQGNFKPVAPAAFEETAQARRSSYDQRLISFA